MKVVDLFNKRRSEQAQFRDAVQAALPKLEQLVPQVERELSNYSFGQFRDINTVYDLHSWLGMNEMFMRRDRFRKQLEFLTPLSPIIDEILKVKREFDDTISPYTDTEEFFGKFGLNDNHSPIWLMYLADELKDWFWRLRINKGALNKRHLRVGDKVKLKSGGIGVVTKIKIGTDGQGNPKVDVDVDTDDE